MVYRLFYTCFLSQILRLRKQGYCKHTFAFALILDFKVWLFFTFGFQKGTLILVGFPIQATHWSLPCDI